jgi:hypothetical protein
MTITVEHLLSIYPKERPCLLAKALKACIALHDEWYSLKSGDQFLAVRYWVDGYNFNVR